MAGKMTRRDWKGLAFRKQAQATDPLVGLEHQDLVVLIQHGEQTVRGF